MKRSRFSEEQVAYALRQAEGGTPVSDVCRQLGIAEATFCVWKRKYSRLEVSEVRKVRQLEEEMSAIVNKTRGLFSVDFWTSGSRCFWESAGHRILSAMLLYAGILCYPSQYQYCTSILKIFLLLLQLSDHLRHKEPEAKRLPG